MTFVKGEAEEDGGKTKVIYTDDQGNKTEYSGGTLSWRNNNPGNIIKGKWANRHGAIGTNRRFAIFPSPESGRNAKLTLLKTKYINYNSIREVLRGKLDQNGNYMENTGYAPASDGNDPDLYADQIQKWTGLSVDNKKIADLTEKEWELLLDGMQKKEGWKAGTVTNLGKEAASSTRGSRQSTQSSTNVKRISSPSANNIYIVKPGDSLSRIARVHNVNTAEIIKANPSITDINRIRVGDKITIPAHKPITSSHTSHSASASRASKPKVAEAPKQSWSVDTILGWTKRHL